VLASPLSLLLLDNLQANLRHWQSVSTDDVSLLTVADSSDDSSPSTADQGDRNPLHMSCDIGHSSSSHAADSGVSRGCESQTQNVLRRASMPPLSATAVTSTAVRRGSSPVVGAQHMSGRKVRFLSSLAEHPMPAIALPSIIFCRHLDTAAELDISRFHDSDETTASFPNDHKNVVVAKSKVGLPSPEAYSCATKSAVHFSDGISTPADVADECAYNSGSNGASLNGVSLMLPKYTNVRRASAPVILSSRMHAAIATRRGSAPTPGAELVAMSMWTSFDAEPPSTVHCCHPSVVLVESPVQQLDVVCVLTDSSSLNTPPEVGRCREKRSHSAHAIIISPARFVERRYSSPMCLHGCWNAGNFINSSSSSHNLTPSVSGFI